MPKFVALITGAGEGCDYTIGCNISWKIGSAETKEEFIKKVLSDYGMTSYESTYKLDIPIEKMQVFEVQDDGLQLNNLDKWYFEEYKKHKKKLEEEKEREEYERLKAKYEGK